MNFNNKTDAELVEYYEELLNFLGDMIPNLDCAIEQFDEDYADD